MSSESVPPGAGRHRAVPVVGESARIREARGVVLVTGTSSGMGLASAAALVRSGYHVIGTVLAPHEAEALLAQVPEGSVSVCVLDISDADQLRATVEWTHRLLREAGVPGLAGLVNNAGVGVSGPMEVVPMDRVRWQFEVNLFGQLALTQALLPLLRAGHGRIVNIGSVGAWVTMPFGGPLTASKAAFRACNDALRMELKPSGIPVVLLEPARVRTAAQSRLQEECDALLAAMSEDDRARYADGYRTMVATAVEEGGQAGSPEPVAAAVVRALTARRPRSRQPIGRLSHVLGLLGRLLPNPLLDRLRYRVLGLGGYARGSG
jgi:NAD(P)-dependent dehydrogenase (short-subunit alcohol dehydrogenase family)